MAPSFDHLLPPNPPKQPGESYVVWTAGPYRPEVERVLVQLIEEAQQDSSPFRPDDLIEELARARRHLAVAPNEPPGLCIYSDERLLYSEEGMPLFQPTHVLAGKIVNVWYVIWEKGHYVGICRLEPNESRNQNI